MSSNEFNKLDREYTERQDYLASRAEERGVFCAAMDNKTPPQTAFMVERLRYIADTDDARFGDISSTLTEAANCIEQLRKDMESTAGKALAAVALRDAEIARLRGLLRERCLTSW